MEIIRALVQAGLITAIVHGVLYSVIKVYIYATRIYYMVNSPNVEARASINLIPQLWQICGCLFILIVDYLIFPIFSNL